MRGWTALGSAPLLTFVLVLVGIVVHDALGLRWRPVSAAAVAAVVVGVAAGLTAWSTRRARQRHGARPLDAGAGHVAAEGDRLWSVLAGVGVLAGTLIGFLTIVDGTGHLDEPNQGFDALFHVNVVELINRTGDVSPGMTGTLNGYAPGTSVYPDAFHAMASLVSQLHGTSLTAINGLLACVPLIAGLGLVALLRSMGLVREAAVVPVLLAATTGYPTDPIWHGPIWVYVFGITFVPAFLVVLRWALAHRSVRSTLVLGTASAGLAMIHPSAALSAAVFAVFWVGVRWVRHRSRLLPDLVVLGSAAVLAGVLVWPLIGKAVIDSSGGTIVDWPVAQSAGQALGELALYNYGTTYPQTWLALPALLGLVVGWRSPALRWWYGGTAAFAVLCIMAAAYEGKLVQVLTGPWWNDRFRFEALVFLGLSVFAAVGVVFLGDALGRLALRSASRVRDGAPRSRLLPTTAGVLVVLLLVGLLSKGFYVEQNRDRFRIAYVPQGGATVGPPDLAAFAALKTLAGAGPVLNDPNDGSPWMWPLAGVRPVFGAALTDPVSPPLPPARQTVIDRLNCLDSDEQVRRAVAALGVRYVYSSNTTILGPPTTNVGFLDLDDVKSLQPVYDRDGAIIYRIDLVPLASAADDAACGQS